ncbi:MAG: ABC transporter substrate-binding protein [Bacteroidota bacterium]|nr:ABC transporter substrate-binding protein [Bacteroidota bacterium]MDP4229229.1 ABC transporter substrate-binding protein [Bacteroidota bacterium]MDP4236052.1 ABC transporter substrate-binding protein [Bacteroidota bacterium]
MKKSLSLFLVVSSISLLLTSCGKKGEEPGNKFGLSTKNNVVWWIAADITNIVPPLAHDAAAQYAYPLIWEPLNGTNARTQELIAGLASLPEISSDHLTYTYTINPAAKFSDGVPFTGEDVIFSFKCVMNPRQIETTQTRSVVTSVDSITFVNGDKMKVAFHLNKPYFQMDIVLGGGYVSMLPKHIFDPHNLTDKMDWVEMKSDNPKNPVFQQEADEFKDPAKIRDPKMMIGTGAYLYGEWKTNDHISFKKNPNYWGKDIPWSEAYPDEITFKTITDNNSAVTALKAKDIDLMDIVPAALFVQLDSVKQPFIKKDTVYYNSRVFVEWNAERPLFRDKKTRWALSHLIDRDLLVKEVMKGLARPINGPINFTQPHYDPSLKPITFDPDLAKKMLAEDGWGDSDGDGILDKVIDGKKTPFHFTFNIYAGSDVVKQAALVIAEQMRKAGIQVDVSSTEWSVWIENTRTHNYDAAIANLLGNASEDDPYELWHSSQAKNKGQNVWSFINAEADQILTQNRTEFDINKRDALMKRFQQIVYDEMPITPLWSPPLRIARIDRFDNVEFFKQRPGFNVPFWIVRGSGIKPKAGAPSTVQPRP